MTKDKMLQAFRKVCGCVTDTKPLVFGGAIRDLIRGEEVTDLDIFIHAKDDPVATMKRVASDLFFRSKFIRHEHYGHNFKVLRGELEGVSVDLVFGQRIDSVWREPDVNVNLLYVDHFADFLASGTTLKVMPSSDAGFALSDILADIVNKRFIAESYATPKRLDKLINKGWAHIES
jgi:hypothetical protein